MSSKNRITTQVQVYILPLWLLLGTSQAVAQPVGQAESLAAWTKIQSVLQHPRCLNCHQAQSPLQGESRRVQTPHVIRGSENHGFSALK